MCKENTWYVTMSSRADLGGKNIQQRELTNKGLMRQKRMWGAALRGNVTGRLG